VKRVFNNIWKSTIQVPKGKVGFWKPKEDIKSVQKDKDRDCCEEAKEDYLKWYVESMNLRKVSHHNNLSDLEVYNEYGGGIRNGDCDRFRESLPSFGSQYPKEILKRWKECETGV
jgi:hypothetical protein